MAGKAKSAYICSECGYESPKWFGCCPGCGEWNTMNEEIKAPVAAAAKSGAKARAEEGSRAPIVNYTKDDIEPSAAVERSGNNA